MHRYIPSTEQEKKEMLGEIGVESIMDLFLDIPENLRLGRDLNLEKSKSEIEVMKHLHKLGAKNKSLDELVCFLGAGSYDHFIPTTIKHLASRSEFFTAYTPYQPEISQGTLRVIFEYQSLMCNLTGMDASNASMYD
ncbi:MAG: glycine dehydrogenase, partial [Acidaminobacteraceae bacterium]